jgi:hypothetical protein
MTASEYRNHESAFVGSHQILASSVQLTRNQLWCLLSSLNNANVIPAKLAIASAITNTRTVWSHDSSP